MRLIDQDGKEIKETDADLTVGYIVEETVIRPDAKPVDHKAKHAYLDEDYEDVKRYIRVPDDVLRERKLESLRKQLADTDYHILKVVEGAATLLDCAEVIKQRAAWRAEINKLEAQREEKTT